MKRALFLLFILITTNLSSFANPELSKQATAFYSDNNPTKTIDLILQINESDRSAHDWILLGNVLEDKGELDNAIFMYKKAIVTDPKFYKSYYNIANHYANNGQYNMAIENYKKAIKLNKENPFVFYNLACTYVKTGELDKAKANLNKAILLRSDIPDFHYNLAYVYKKLDKHKLAQTYLDNFNKLTSNY